MKICSKCGEEKDDGEFHKNKNRKGGLQPHCKKCRAVYNVANRESIAAYDHVYNAENKEHRAAQRRVYYAENKEYFRVRNLAWRLDEANRFSAALFTSRKDAKNRGHVACLATPDELEVTFTGACHFCGLLEEEHGKRLCIDHDHETGEFRGWLCTACNVRDVLDTKETSNDG